MVVSRVLRFGLVGLWVLLSAVVAAEERSMPLDLFARVDGEPIDSGRYQRRLVTEMRDSFYHGRVPAEEVQPFRNKVAELLLDEYLLAREARRRGLVPDAAKLEQRRQALEQRNGDNPQWQQARDRLLPQFVADWEAELLADQLRQRVREVAEPTAVQVRGYYEDHPELFTEPASHRVAMILLGVDPGGGEAAWLTAEARADELYQQLQAGADFATLAELHSTDFTAEQGGDMGVLHQGMVGDEVQNLVEKLQPGEVGEPLRLLQGVALFRLTERIPERHHPLEAVAQRAASLWRREQAELAAELLLFELRQAADIQLNEAVVTLPGSR